MVERVSRLTGFMAAFLGKTEKPRGHEGDERKSVPCEQLARGWPKPPETSNLTTRLPSKTGFSTRSKIELPLCRNEVCTPCFPREIMSLDKRGDNKTNFKESTRVRNKISEKMKYSHDDM